MLCPYCKYDESNVIESRDALEGRATRRRRECLRCNKRFTTYEKVGDVDLKVIKKNGKVEVYKREKLEKCMEKACWKLGEEERSVIVDDIEMKLLNWTSVEIPSKDIASMILKHLKKIDPVAYIRFATIYLKIQSVEEFEKLLKNYKEKKKN
jgi:transcriptional repressor NrdR